MINSDTCWMSGVEKDDCDYDQGGHFIIKGAKKVTSYMYFLLVYFY